MKTKNVLIICTTILLTFILLSISTIQTAKEGIKVSMDNNTLEAMKLAHERATFNQISDACTYGCYLAEGENLLIRCADKCQCGEK